MANTTNFNWETPDDTDLVKDGAAAMRTLGNSIDTSFVDLKGGTTGQILSKASNTDLDYTWVTTDDANAIQNAIVDAKGDIVAASAADTPARLAVGSNGETLVADSSTSTGLRYQGLQAAGKNFVNNGGYDVWQRGTSFAAVGSAQDYTADRWKELNNTGLSTYSRQATGDTTNLPFVQYCMRVQRNSGQTATGAIYVTQSLESVNSIPLAGRTVTFSFYARAGANFSATSNVLSTTVSSGTGTDQNINGGFTGAVNVVNAGAATLTTTWQRFSFTGTVGSTATQLGYYFFYTPTGTAGANDYFEVTGVQLEVGSVATQFTRQGGTIQGELAACQRYYFRSTPTTAYGWLGSGMGQGATSAVIGVNIPVTMRIAPTGGVDFSTIALVDGSTSYAVTACTIDTNVTSQNFGVVNATVASGLTQYRPYYLRQNANSAGNIGFSAEL
jgi:hypothetical protein